MSETGSAATLPWQVSREELFRSAGEVARGGALVVFVIDDSIPKRARGGYAALVIAYARADEPVTILDDGGAALLVRDGGVTSGRVVAERVLEQMRRLALERTIRAGVAALDGAPEAVLDRAHAAAAAAEAGRLGVAG